MVDGFDGVFVMLYLFGLGGGGVLGAAAWGCCDSIKKTLPLLSGTGLGLGGGGGVGFFAMSTALAWAVAVRKVRLPSAVAN